MGGVVEKVVDKGKSFVGTAFNILGGNFNAYVALGVFAIGWLFSRSLKPDVPDFGTNDFEETERGILLNKQSNNACIPVIYGERLVGGTRVFIETSGTDNTYLYVALVLSEGEVNSIEQVIVDDKVVTFDGALTHGTTREVASSDSNFYKDSTSHIQIQAFMGTDDQVASSVLTPLSSKLYNQNEQQNNSDDQSDEKPEDNTVDADFEEVKEDK